MNIIVKYINFWEESPTNIHGALHHLKRCLKYGFEQLNMNIIENNQSNQPDIIVTSVFGHPNSLSQYVSKNVFIIVFTGENTCREYYKQWSYERLNSIYPIGAYIGFDRSECENRFRIPLWVLYKDFYNFNRSEIRDIIQRNDINVDHISLEKRCNSVCIISRHGGNDRTTFYNKCIDAKIKVLCGGRFKNNDNTLKTIEASNIDLVDSKIKYMSNHLFNLCCENSNTSGYCTEKLLECCLAGCIPIYWGDDDIEAIFNTKRIIKVDVNDVHGIDDAVSTMTKMMNDRNYLNEFFYRPIFTSDALDHVDVFIQKFVSIASRFKEVYIQS